MEGQHDMVAALDVVPSVDPGPRPARAMGVDARKTDSAEVELQLAGPAQASA